MFKGEGHAADLGPFVAVSISEDISCLIHEATNRIDTRTVVCNGEWLSTIWRLRGSQVKFKQLVFKAGWYLLNI